MVFSLTPRLPTVKVTTKIDGIFSINVQLLQLTPVSLCKTNVFNVTDSPDGDSWKV